MIHHDFIGPMPIGLVLFLLFKIFRFDVFQTEGTIGRFYDNVLLGRL